MLYDVWFLRYKASQRELLVILGQFFPSDSPNNLKNEKCEKMKKSHGDIIIIHLCNINYNHIYDVWFLRYGVGFTELFVILGHFSPSAPLKTYKIKTLIEWKKKDLEISSEFFCHFGLVFALYAPPPHLRPIPNPPQQQPGKSKLSKTENRPRDIIILHISTINDNHIMYDSSDMKRIRQHFLLFWAIFCPFTSPNNLENQNFEKTKRNTWRYHCFIQVYQKSWSYAILFLRCGMWWI